MTWAAWRVAAARSCMEVDPLLLEDGADVAEIDYRAFGKKRAVS